MTTHPLTAPQMLFRGANAVGYSVYPDNAVFKVPVKGRGGTEEDQEETM